MAARIRRTSSSVSGRRLGSFGKRRSVADSQRLWQPEESLALEADGPQPALYTWLSAILLRRLLLNARRADPVAALVMLPIIARDRLEGIPGERCNDGCGD